MQRAEVERLHGPSLRAAEDRSQHQKRDDVFVVMSFAPEFEDRWNRVIEPCIREDLGLMANRVDYNQSGESIVHDIGEMQIGDTIPLEAVVMPAGVTLLDDVSETIIATLSPPRLQVEEEEELEAETELVGEEAEGAEAAEGAEEPAAEGPSGEE